MDFPQVPPGGEFVYPSAKLNTFLDRLGDRDESCLGDLTKLLGDRESGLTASDLEKLHVNSRMNRYVTHVGSLQENMHRWKLARDWFFKEGKEAKAMVTPMERHLMPNGPGRVRTPTIGRSAARGSLVTAVVIDRAPSPSRTELVHDFERRADRLTPRAVNDVSWPLVGTKLWTREAAETYTQSQTLCQQQRHLRDERDAPAIQPQDLMSCALPITPPMKPSDLSLALVLGSRKHRMPMKSQLIPQYHTAAHRAASTPPMLSSGSSRGVSRIMTQEQLAQEQIDAVDSMESALLATLPTLKTSLAREKVAWTSHIANRAIVGRYHGVRPLRKLKSPCLLSTSNGATTPGSPAGAFTRPNITRNLLNRTSSYSE